MKKELFLGLTVRAALAVLVGFFAGGPAKAGELVVEGPVEIGDGLPNGLGATLGHVFLKLGGLDLLGNEEVPLALSLSSSLVSVEPTTCSAPSESPCPEPGSGAAGVLGYPTAASLSVFRLKLAGAHYLPARLPAGLAGSSVEVSFEGALTVDDGAPAGSAVRLRLLLGQVAHLLEWGADHTRAPADRAYENNTGAGLLLGDVSTLFFPGTVEGEVMENNGNTLLVMLTRADIVTLDAAMEPSRMSLRPDSPAALEAGLPAGAFGLIEINYSGFPSISRVFPPAASNDVELHITSVTSRPNASFFLRGDCNADGSATGSVSDAVFLLLFSFTNGRRPPCLEACDANGDGRIVGEVTDAVYLMTFNFLGGPPPPLPFPTCGLGMESGLSCESYPPCGGV